MVTSPDGVPALAGWAFSAFFAAMPIWSYPTRVVFGAGEIKTLGAEARRAGIGHALIVTDAGVVAAGLVEPVEAALADAGVRSTRFAEVIGNPTEANVEEAAAAARSAGVDGLVGLGGGSPMDVAKLVAVRLATAAPWSELDDAIDGGVHIPERVLPIVTVPTTAGTGSEVGRSGVLTSASTGRKMVIFAPQLMPRAAILDPELTVKLPAKVTAATGFDALTHNVEAYLATGDHPMADAIAIAGVDLAAKFLGRAVADGKNLEARGALMKAAMMGAVAFQKGLGACHSLAHPLSSEHGLHHGLANALCLAAVLDFNERAVLEKVLHVGLLLGGEPKPGEAARAVKTLKSSLGLPRGLSDVGIRREHLPKLAQLALADACHRSNPRPCLERDLLAMYEASF